MELERAVDAPAATPQENMSDPGALGARENGQGEAEDIGNTEWWCNRCGQPVLLAGDDDMPVSLRKAVHAATGAEKGAPDGHIAAPIDYEPPLWQAARELEAETGGLFTVSARYGFLRADRADLAPGVVAAHFTASDKAEMQVKLRRVLIAAGKGQGTPILRSDTADR
jgi:hypothetical protein